MTGYWVNDLSVVLWLAVFLGVIPLIGFPIATFGRLAIARGIAWMVVVVAVLLVERMSAGEPSGTRMLLIITALLWSMKAVVFIEARQDGRCVLTFWQWFGFCVAWFGMRAALFKKVPAKPLSDWQEFVWRGITRMILGIALMAGAWMVAHGGFHVSQDIAPWQRWTATALLLPGLSLFVHFGMFNVLTGVWRYFGARCSALFRAPLLSQSLAEFWGQRWNLAFSEMTALAVFRPIKQWPGNSQGVATFAMIVGFLFSGVLHEIAISVPVGAGFGLPTLYFVIHGIGMVLEKRLKFLDSALLGRIWTAAWVLLPLPILFHRPFLEGCVWPIMRM